MSIADDLTRLEELRRQGAIDTREFEEAKALLLAGQKPEIGRQSEYSWAIRTDPAPAPTGPSPTFEGRGAPRGRSSLGSGAAPPGPALALGAVGIVVVVLIVLGLVYYLGVRPRSYEDITGAGAPWSTSSGGLTLTVTRIEASPSRCRVHMTARNETSDQLTLPVFGYFFLVDDRGKQYKGEPFSSSFPRDVAPGATTSGYVEIRQPLDRTASELRAGFSTVFGSFAVDSIEVKGIRVR